MHTVNFFRLPLLPKEAGNSIFWTRYIWSKLGQRLHDRLLHQGTLYHAIFQRAKLKWSSVLFVLLLFRSCLLYVLNIVYSTFWNVQVLVQELYKTWNKMRLLALLSSAYTRGISPLKHAFLARLYIIYITICKTATISSKFTLILLFF